MSYQTRDEQGKGKRPPTRKGMDLAQMQRERENVQKRSRAQAAAERKRAGKKPGRARPKRRKREEFETFDPSKHKSSGLYELSLKMKTPTFRIAAAAVILALVLAALLPRLIDTLNAPMSRADLDAAQVQIDAAAGTLLGAPVGSPEVIEHDEMFTVTYNVKRRTKLYDGGRATRDCSVVYTVDRLGSTANKLVYTQGDIVPCTGKAK